MRKHIYRVLVVVGIVITILIGLVAFDFGFRRGQTPPIAGTQNSVASLEKITLGGAEQWILIRGWNKSNPVVLFLHGGPGMPAMYLAHAFQRQLEKDFVIVHWDRRGAGKSYAAGLKSDITVRQTLDDTFELTRMLLARFGHRKLYLVGHSWGSYLGMLAIREHPEYYAAYIGVGQDVMSPRREYDAQKNFLVRRAREAGDQTLVSALRSDSSRIREDDLFRYGAELHESTSMWPLLLSGLRAPEYTLTDALNLKKGVDLVSRKMRSDVISGALSDNVHQVEIPIFFFLGKYDYVTPSILAAEYLDSLACPLKRIVWFEGSAHFPFYEEPNRFRDAMVNADSVAAFFWSTARNPARIESRTFK